jgi:glycosyltransferase involved in cell wall biosynthesis
VRRLGTMQDTYPSADHEPKASGAECSGAETAPGADLSASVRPRTQAPTVTIIIPTYNRAHVLGQTLDSVKRQSFSDYEIVLVDDGSQDETRRVVSNHAMPIRYIYQPNKGVSEARNHAVRLARGEFLAFLDSDDLWEPTFLERTVRRLRTQPDEVLVYTDFVSVNAEGQPLRGHRKTPCGGQVTVPLFASVFIHTSAVVARRLAIIDAAGFDPNLSHNEDYDLWLRLSLRHRFGLIREPLCLRRCHADSLSRNGCTPQIRLDKARLLEHFYEDGGGRYRIPPNLARKRLGKLYYTAAKAMLKAGEARKADSVFRQALQWNTRSLRTWLWFSLSHVARLRTDRSAAAS